MPQDLLYWLLGGLALIFVVRYAMAARGRISGADARAKVAAGAQLLDVRSLDEFKGGSLPSARNIPVRSLPQRLGELDRSRALVVFCASGVRSSSAAALLRRSGFSEVHDLGPASAW